MADQGDISADESGDEFEFSQACNMREAENETATGERPSVSGMNTANGGKSDTNAVSATVKPNVNPRPNTKPNEGSSKPRTSGSSSSKKGETTKVKSTPKVKKVVDRTNERLDRLESLLEGFISSVYQGQTDQFTTDLGLGLSDQEMDESGSSTSTSNTTAVDDVQQPQTAERKQNIGFASRFAAPEEVGKPAPEGLANSLNYLMSSKLEDKQITDTCIQYLQPDNCQHLVVPKVNPMIWENLNSKTRSLDLRLQRIQKPLVKGLTALVTTLYNKQFAA